MPTPEARAAAIIDTGERAAASFARALAQVWKQAERRLIGLVQSASEGRPTAIIRAAQALQAREAMRRVLTDAGYDALVLDATDGPLTSMAARVLATDVAQLAQRYGDTFAQRIDALKALQAMDLLEEGDRAARALWSAVTRGVFGAQAPRVIMADLAPVLDRAQHQIETLYDTSVSIFGRQVEALQAGNDPDTPFLYAGPDDPLVRPFCAGIVGQTFTRAQIDTMENGQLNNVFLTGGGYNCRHVWLEVVR